MNPDKVVIELNMLRHRLSDEIERLKEKGDKYAKSRCNYKKNFAIKTALLKSGGASAAGAEQEANGQLADMKGTYELDKILWETTNMVVRAKIAECNVLQSVLKGLSGEWNQSV